MNLGKTSCIALLMGASAGILWAGLTASAQDASALYNSKCAACHGADGTGNTVVGKTLQIKSFADPGVQKMTDADFIMIVTKGKDKMPAYGKMLKPNEIKELVGYIRDLGKK